jgi:hypothetical protein
MRINSNHGSLLVGCPTHAMLLTVRAVPPGYLRPIRIC